MLLIINLIIIALSRIINMIIVTLLPANGREDIRYKMILVIVLTLEPS